MSKELSTHEALDIIYNGGAVHLQSIDIVVTSRDLHDRHGSFIKILHKGKKVEFKGTRLEFMGKEYFVLKDKERCVIYTKNNAYVTSKKALEFIENLKKGIKE